MITEELEDKDLVLLFLTGEELICIFVTKRRPRFFFIEAAVFILGLGGRKVFWYTAVSNYVDGMLKL